MKNRVVGIPKAPKFHRFDLSTSRPRALSGERPRSACKLLQHPQVIQPSSVATASASASVCKHHDGKCASGCGLAVFSPSLCILHSKPSACPKRSAWPLGHRQDNPLPFLLPHSRAASARSTHRVLRCEDAGGRRQVVYRSNWRRTCRSICSAECTHG